MDIATDYIRVYLSDRVCGNTVLRLLTNLQHRYDATASANQIIAEPTAGDRVVRVLDEGL